MVAAVWYPVNPPSSHLPCWLNFMHVRALRVMRAAAGILWLGGYLVEVT